MINHWHCVRILPTDYTDYGGQIKRWEEVEGYYPDCNDCKYFNRLHDKENNRADSDWGVCTNPKSQRKGLLTWEHQSGVGCHVSG